MQSLLRKGVNVMSTKSRADGIQRAAFINFINDIGSVLRGFEEHK